MLSCFIVNFLGFFKKQTLIEFLSISVDSDSSLLFDGLWKLEEFFMLLWNFLQFYINDFICPKVNYKFY